MTLITRRALGLGFLAVPWPASGGRARGEDPLVAAAADLKFALDELAGAFTSNSGLALRITYGSTGNFARQIRKGAKFEVFLAADESFVLDLWKDGLALDAGVLYAEGRIVMLVPKDGNLKADTSLSGLSLALDEGRVTRFAIANPEHAPYGRRTEEALRHAGLWEAVRPFLVMGENVAQAAQFALSGNAEGGIVAYSLALAPDVAARAEHALIPAAWHAPLLQRMALLPGAGDTARQFYAFLQAPAAREVLSRYGFAFPD